MIRYIGSRLIQAVAVLAVVGFISFAMFRFVGDPVNNLLGQEATQADYDDLVERLGLDDPVPVQYALYLGRLFSGDMGVSYRQGRPVADLIAERVPATLELAVLSAVFALAGGIGVGIYTAVHRGSPLAFGAMTVSLVGVSLPTFLIGILLIWVFAVELRWFPPLGRGEVVDVGFWTTGLLTRSGLSSLVLPVLTLGFYQLALIMRLVRAEMLEVLQTDYIRTARANGLPGWRVLTVHALGNALIPVIAISGLQFGSVIAFGIVTESVFQWPGLGLLFVDAIRFVDIPVMAGYLLVVASVFVAVNLVVDIALHIADPRADVIGRGSGGQ